MLETRKFHLGQVVSSKAGRDKGELFLIVGVEGERFVFVADGETRKIACPKRKNIRHLVFHQAVARDIEAKLTAGEETNDAEICFALKGFELNR